MRSKTIDSASETIRSTLWSRSSRAAFLRNRIAYEVGSTQIAVPEFQDQPPKSVLRLEEWYPSHSPMRLTHPLGILPKAPTTDRSAARVWALSPEIDSREMPTKGVTQDPGPGAPILTGHPPS